MKPTWILLKQETVSGSGISRAIYNSASRSRQITMPVPHHSSFFTGRTLFLLPNQQRQSTEGTHRHSFKNRLSRYLFRQCGFMDAVRICGPGSMKRLSVRLSVRLSFPSIDNSNGRRRVCCWAPRGQEILRDRKRRRSVAMAAAVGITHGARQQMRAASR